MVIIGLSQEIFLFSKYSYQKIYWHQNFKNLFWSNWVSAENMSTTRVKSVEHVLFVVFRAVARWGGRGAKCTRAIKRALFHQKYETKSDKNVLDNFKSYLFN